MIINYPGQEALEAEVEKSTATVPITGSLEDEGGYIRYIARNELVQKNPLPAITSNKHTY